MAEESTQLIIGDAAVDALGQQRKRGFFCRRRKPAEKLTHCENCGTPLAGEYCSACGQHAIDYRRSLWRVVVDAADSFLNWDTKFLKSIGVLLTRPGKLTNDFNAGRRVRYIHPLRLYLLASIGFFLLARLANFTPSEPIDLTPEDRAELDAELGKLTAPDSRLTPEQRERVDEVRRRFMQTDEALGAEERARIDKLATKLPRFADKKELKPADVAKLDALLDRAPGATPSPHGPPPADQTNATPIPPKPPESRAYPKDHPLIQFDSDKEERSDFGAWLEERVRQKIGEDGTNAELFFATLRSHVPTMMLCCIPLFALVLKILYLRQRRFYVEHLVYALHIHSFVYVAIVVITLLGMAAERWLPPLQTLLVFGLSFVVAAQVFLSIRCVYGQSRFWTICKFVLGTVTYLFVLVAALGATAFITLLLP